MKVCWIHSFPTGVKNSGIFMWDAYSAVHECGVEVDAVKILDRKRPLQTIAAIGSIRGGRFDVLHSQYGSGCGTVAGMIPGRKVLTLRGSDWYGSVGNGLTGQIRGVVSRRLTLQMMDRFDLLIAESARMAREIQQFTKKRTIVLPNGVDLRRFRPMNRSEARGRLGENHDDRPWILFASTGRAKPVKRPLLARDVVDIVKREHPEVQLKMATNVPHELMPVLVNASDCVLVTSVHEGWPNIVKEALACDVPFVSTDVSDVRELAEVTGTCQVRTDDPEDLADAVLDVLKAGRPEGLRSFVQDMDMRRYARRLALIYRDLLGGYESDVSKGLERRNVLLGSA